MNQTTAVTIANTWFISLAILAIAMAILYFYATRGYKTTRRKI